MQVIAEGDEVVPTKGPAREGGCKGSRAVAVSRVAARSMGAARSKAMAGSRLVSGYMAVARSRMGRKIYHKYW